jgi:hypothetical protein
VAGAEAEGPGVDAVPPIGDLVGLGFVAGLALCFLCAVVPWSGRDVATLVAPAPAGEVLSW